MWHLARQYVEKMKDSHQLLDLLAASDSTDMEPGHILSGGKGPLYSEVRLRCCPKGLLSYFETRSLFPRPRY